MLGVYPDSPGFAEGRETSEQSALDISLKAATLRYEARKAFERGWTGTDWQLAMLLGEEFESVQPRRSELTATGLVIDTGNRSNDSRSGKTVVVWGINENPPLENTKDKKTSKKLENWQIAKLREALNCLRCSTDFFACQAEGLLLHAIPELKD